MTQALLLVGGKGTRLHPLTLTRPKPMVPAGGVPIMEHLVRRAAEAGVTRLVLATSYLPDAFRAHFGDGSAYGIELCYITEETPLGTGGAIRNAAEMLTSGPDEPVLVFNGDILSGLDIADLVRRHRDAKADVTLHLTRVADPRAFGLVPTDEDNWVLDFREKPTTPEEIVTDQINAGCYVFTRSVIDRIPAGREVSVEREVFPGLLADGGRVLGVVDTSYWLDLGTPQAFVKGSTDLVRGLVPSPALPGPRGEALVLDDAEVADSATLSGGTTIGRKAVVREDTRVHGSVVMDGVVIGAGADIESCVLGENATVADGVVLRDAVIADGDHVSAVPAELAR
ncbi:mannose-1-phosphate guanylyltransferase [Streptacidiphilus fuscans]|uniref:NDP-sugar synthase n=1 Tax=Streptacidiphilus fuscans TaxID=2789292 RepID=A0A931B0X2_9ACTN|nr:NDP-sugar synthase [Streptacidiphilus fuscans]MBF9068276.1 NDP-sugar synthase [Streptacidiphilus fuscans]